MPVIFKRDKAEGADGAVGRICCDDIDLVCLKGAIEKPEVHGARGGRKAESVSGAEARKAVGALFKLVADAEAPVRGETALPD